MKEILNDETGSGYKLTNRSRLTLKSKNGRKHEIIIETLTTEFHSNGLHRAGGGGKGWSKKYFMSVNSADASDRDAKLAAWLINHPELVEA